MKTITLLFSIVTLLIYSEPISAEIIYSENFDDGLPSSGWSYWNNQGLPAESNIVVSEGQLLLVSFSEENWLNEAILTVDITGCNDITLSFNYGEYSDEMSQSLPASFSTHYPGDGVAWSQDGINWNTLVSEFWPTPDSNAASPVSVSIPVAGVVMLKFQQYADFGFHFLSIDDIIINGTRGGSGSLNVTISPIEAISAGAQWRRTGTTTWYNSSDTETDIPVGSYTVEFKNINGWVSPFNQGVTISNGSTTNINGNYVEKLHYSGGSGLQTDPYQIGDVADWLELINSPSDWDKHFILMSDIDFEGSTITPVATEATFTGTFNGSGNVLNNFIINQPANGYVGLFGHIGSGSQIQNLGVENFIIIGGSYVGGLVGSNQGGSITTCYATGSVSGTNCIGGLVGYSESDAAAVSNCYTTGSVSGTGYCTGGLVGYNFWGTISNCYATVSVSGNDHVGGLVGLSEVEEPDMSEPPMPVPVEAPWLVINSFWDTQTSGQTASSGGTGKTTAEMQTISTFCYAGWDFVNVWNMPWAGGYPILAWQESSGFGSLKVTITPQEAIAAGGQWRRYGTTSWYESYDTEPNIRTGFYIVEFKNITDWNPPLYQVVIIYNALTTIFSGAYVDGTPPHIDNIGFIPSSTQCTISWTTNEPSTSQVRYGLTYYNKSSPLQSELVINHTVTLTGLIPDTIYHYCVRSRDSSGNVAESSDYTFITISDIMPPETALSSGPTENGTACGLPVSFTWTGTDNATAVAQLVYSYQMDDLGWSEYAAATSISYSDLVDGLHTFEVKARDLASNEDPTPAVRNFILNANPPVISDVSADPGLVQCTISWTTDGSPISLIEYGPTEAYGYSVASTSQSENDHTATLTDLNANTTYHFRIRAIDLNCWHEATSTDHTFLTLNDVTPPDTIINSGPMENETVCGFSLNITWTGTDDATAVAQLVYSYQIDGLAWSDYVVATSVSYSNLMDGAHAFEVKAKDQSGNEDLTSANRTFYVDTVPPSLSNVLATPNAGSAIISWNTNKPCASQVEYGLDSAYGLSTTLSSSLVTTHNVTITDLEPTTIYHYRVKSEDSCGRETVSDDFTFSTIQDTTAPNTYITSAPAHNGKACDTTVDFSWTGSDDVTPAVELQYAYKLDDNQWSNWTFETSYSFIGLSDGLHTVLIKAQDSSGNEDSTPAYRNFYVDLTSPVISDIVVIPRDYRATITWNTNEPATSLVEYGVTSGYGITSSSGTTMMGVHTVSINGLIPETTYHFRVKSSDGCREVVSADQIFTTTEFLPPNLSVTSLIAPQTTIAMATINVSWQVKNKGPGDISSSWLDGFYLSTDEFSDSNDIEISIIPQNMTLLEGSTYSRSVQLEMPLVPEGDYYLIARTDAGETVSEADESDNFLARPIQFLHVKTMVITPSEVSLNLNPTVAVTGQLNIGNLSIAPLSGIAAVVENAAQNISIEIEAPTDLNSMQMDTIHYTITASDESVLQNSPTVRFTSNEGEETIVTFNLRVIPGYPRLAATPGYLDAGMRRGAQTLVQCEVLNNGAALASNLVVQLPSTPWMSLVTPAEIGDLGPGEKTKIVLSLMPSMDLQLGPYTGSIAVTGTNAGLSIGFRFNAISDRIGHLKITASDEFTYYADNHPPVAGAKVELKDASTGEVLAQHETDPNGICKITSLTEGYYILEVSAEKHGTYRSTIEVLGGQLKEVNAFLPRQLVTYTWNVVPVELEDRYDVQLETTFETHVPAPVITVEPMVLDLSTVDFDANGEAVVNYTITNYGFIGVEDVRIEFGIHPDYSMTPYIEDLGTVNALSSIVVPVTVTNLAMQQSIARVSSTDETQALSAESSTGCGLTGYLNYIYDCGGVRIGIVPLIAITGKCSPSSNSYILGEGSARSSGVSLFNPSFDQNVNCIEYDECQFGIEKAWLRCGTSLVGKIPIISHGKCLYSIITGGSFCLQDLIIKGRSFGSAVTCTKGLVGALASCGDAAAPIGWTWTAVSCIHTFLGACPQSVAIDSFQDALNATSYNSSFSTLNEREDSLMNDLMLLSIGLDRLNAIADAFTVIYGDPIWFSGPLDENISLSEWFASVEVVTDEWSDSGYRISDSEAAQLRSILLPSQLTSENVDAYIARWNRTLDYWEEGIFYSYQVTEGESDDFVAIDILSTIFNDAAAAVEADRQDGYEDIFDGVWYSLNQVIEDTSSFPEGVCAQVRIRLDQQVTITRTAFKATLEIENASENVDLENVRVVLNIQDANSFSSNDRFGGIFTPELTNVSDIDGTGLIISGTTASAVWTLIPTHDAAPDVPAQYYVGGTLEYVQDGTLVSIPLFPAPILVKPDPQLVLDYFFARDVFGDDPFTDPIEPSEPFSLGLLMSNLGKGTARNVRITSSQPEIVDNEKGLLVDFNITGTQVNSGQVSPSLTVDLGDIGPSETSTAQWIMTSSLQGTFVEYNATFEHVDELGDERLSLIESINTHELTHMVKVDISSDDSKPDFLANDIPDGDNLPDTLYNSNGSIEVVNIGINSTILGNLSAANLQVSLNSTVPSGCIYIRVDDPGMDQFRLVSVIRSDGREISVGENAWTTHRTVRLEGQPEYQEILLHIFDIDSTGIYTLIYEEIPSDSAPPTSSVSALPSEQSTSIFTVCWDGEDNTDGSGLKNFDVYAKLDDGDWLLWLPDTILRCASYVGQPGHSYSFYSIAEDVAGNIEMAPEVPDATTTVASTNPTAEFEKGRLNSETQTYDFSITYTDVESIDIPSLDSGDIRVTGPGDFEQFAAFLDVDIATNGTPRTAHYQISAPGGSWDFLDNGIYRVWSESNQVKNTRGNFVIGGLLKTFEVMDKFSGQLKLESYNIVSVSRVGQTAFEYVFTVTMKNTTSTDYSGVEFELFDAPANMIIVKSNVGFAVIGAGQSTTSESTLKVLIDLSSTTDLYGIPWRVTGEPKTIISDFTGDGHVNVADLVILASYWLSDEPSFDIAPPPNGDGIVNFLDFAEISKEWNK